MDGHIEHISSSKVGCAGAKGFWMVGRDIVSFCLVWRFHWCGLSGVGCSAATAECSKRVQPAPATGVDFSAVNAVRGVRSQPKQLLVIGSALFASF
mmetsp:Transcript_24495/g.68920  ORF Transcript_24495/g.68920 Transcript_24495/m.68920 type:complete len:96 (+) Transcript_24495:288-575(+)